MQYCNAVIYAPDHQFHRGNFSVENGRFQKVLYTVTEKSAIDLNGAYVLPGFVDVHCHGALGVDCSQSTLEQLRMLAAYWACCGVTSFVATEMTQEKETLLAALSAAAAFAKEAPAGSAVLRGIRLEGPFLSMARRGAQNEKYLEEASLQTFEALNTAAQGMLRVLDIAPELNGALELIGYASKHCVVSLAHTDADYAQAKAAFAAGASHVTHLCNAMKPMHHRAPGVIPAAAESLKVTVEIIGDGKHVHPSMLRLLYHAFGAERICLISDAISCCGMENTASASGGQAVTVRDGLAYLADGTIAGSALNLFEVFQNTLKCGILPEDAVRMASENPARLLGAQTEVGSVANGKRADFLLCGADFSLQRVFCAGEQVK